MSITMILQAEVAKTTISINLGLPEIPVAGGWLGKSLTSIEGIKIDKEPISHQKGAWRNIERSLPGGAVL